jgi:regulatory protein SWI6
MAYRIPFHLANLDLAMQDLIRSLENDFQKELDGKQSTVTTTLSSLRDVTSRLGAERSRANDLRTKVRKISDLRQACRNLKRALQEQPVTEGLPTPAEEGTGGAVIAGTAAGPNGTATPAPPAEGRRASIADEQQEASTADTPYTLQNSLLAPVHSISNLTTTQLAYIKSLPPSTLLKSRLKGYKRNERSLQGTAQKLKEKSMDLENNFRRVVALSTGIEEQNVDGLIEGLVMAVESDPGEVDTNRVVGFLRKIGEADT